MISPIFQKTENGGDVFIHLMKKLQFHRNHLPPSLFDGGRPGWGANPTGNHQIDAPVTSQVKASTTALKACGAGRLNLRIFRRNMVTFLHNFLMGEGRDGGWEFGLEQYHHPVRCQQQYAPH
jgi:hypothetical protein